MLLFGFLLIYALASLSPPASPPLSGSSSVCVCVCVCVCVVCVCVCVCVCELHFLAETLYQYFKLTLAMWLLLLSC